MNIESKELLLKMKEYDFVYDTTVGKMVNTNSQEDKAYVFKILDLLYENFHKVRFVDDLSESVIGKGKWAVLISQKFAMVDKRIPIPQVPFHLKYDGKDDISMKAKHSYFLLIGFFQELDDEIYVSLNFKNEEYRRVYKELVKK
ncbi:hypothetical protein CSV78_15215 [Sporosarcina sp. P16a]|uniref:hypothetical protein n=1 Tax=unclassified Sporosarcina TaxID=2647733 RepID=UPI000C1644FB|nr:MULTISPECIES: hypothetical protein [unclassified Sporosarcina]PIC65916.1 hypothetical protein CSV78_15215 [Sporosarcina sp. P16a]PIC91983.1 hypothetical protein CSV70_12630 [Sporosarcina sp. P25]